MPKSQFWLLIAIIFSVILAIFFGWKFGETMTSVAWLGTMFLNALKMLIVPLVLLDLFVSLYQALCFPAYGIEKVRRRDYLVFDRHHLAYLNLLQKLNCAYCSYANGLLAYVGEIAARTEQYWCPIKHARRLVGMHARSAHFSDFGDAEAFQRDLDRLRDLLKPESSKLNE